jgi:hypothetical protein
MKSIRYFFALVLLIISSLSAQNFENDKYKESAAEESSPVSTGLGSICMQAEADAKANVNRTIWTVAGCLIGPTGLLIAYIAEPSPPASGLIGKNADYILMYKECYAKKGKSVQVRAALTGCGACAAAYLAYLIIAFSVSAGSY